MSAGPWGGPELLQHRPEEATALPGPSPTANSQRGTASLHAPRLPRFEQGKLLLPGPQNKMDALSQWCFLARQEGKLRLLWLL